MSRKGTSPIFFILSIYFSETLEAWNNGIVIFSFLPFLGREGLSNLLQYFKQLKQDYIDIFKKKERRTNLTGLRDKYVRFLHITIAITIIKLIDKTSIIIQRQK